MRRRLFTLISALSLVLGAASAVLWVRSFRVLDQWHGQAGRFVFEINSFSGRYEIFLWRSYIVRPGINSDIDLYEDHRPFDSLTELPVVSGNSLARQRWPLADTEKWELHATLFPGLRWESWLTWARDGPGRWTWCRVVQVPYWLLLVIFAIGPAVTVIRLRRPVAPSRSGLCRVCGYDLRASPVRCPECGTPVPSPVTVAATVPG